ncbi:hypothetical protein BGX34_005386 [Mortierella sp. NVP85]|nr:hypothetical protein BGX34_005386 [Mortierella sp. NVP85]
MGPQTIDLGPHRDIHKDDFVNLISKCKNLKKVIIRNYPIEAIIEYQDVALQEWLCRDLIELHLTLSRPSIEPGIDEHNSNEEENGINNANNANNEDDDEGGECRRSRRLQLYKAWVCRKAKEAYGQIGRMTKLEELYLRSNKGRQRFNPVMRSPSYDLTLEHGWLGELAGLKELKRFGMFTNLWSRMGQAEVEFMDAQWPKLEMITFNILDSENASIEFEFIIKERLVAQYLSGHDIIQCMATSKAWAHLFEPFLWQDILLTRLDPVPQTLALNRHRIRSFRVAHDDYINLCTLASDLPSVPSLSPNNLDPASGPSKSCSSTIASSATGSNIFQSLRTIHIGHTSQTGKLDEKGEICLAYIYRIINQSPGLLQVILHGEILNHDKSHSLLYILEHKLPYLKRLDFTSAQVDLDIGLKLLRVCFNHPQLADLNYDFSMLDDHHKLQRLEAFLMASEEDNKAKKALGEPAAGTRIKNLLLPRLPNGYPPTFVCTLLRSHLPNLEGFNVPDIYNYDGTPYVDLLKEAVAQGCPKLQHIKFAWNEYERNMQEAVDGMIQGCKEMSLKSFYCENFDDVLTHNDGQRTLRTLLNDHFTTLEEVELVYYGEIHHSDLMELFTMCKNLRAFTLGPIESGNASVRFQDIVLQEWVCHDLRDLRMIISRPRIGLEEEEEEDSDKESESEAERMDPDLVRAMAKKAYGQIGRLSKLEILCLGCDEREEQETPMEDYEYDLTLEHGWLAELAGLRELRHLHMATDFWSRMGQAEVEFMDANWPKLEKITFRCYGSESSEGIMERPHWQWLQERRPHLEHESDRMFDPF